MSRFCGIFLKLKLIWIDMGCDGSKMRDDLLSLGVRQEVIRGIKPKGIGFLVQPKRWIVEKTF